MAIRGDLSVDWAASPRVITIAAPSKEITIQDLHDTCRSLEAEPVAMDDKPLIDSSGYEDLGGSTKVGITATLQNALLAFEARTGPTYEQCSVSGGNLVAVDGVGSTIKTPISPTAFTQVVVTASSSATSSSQAALEAGLFDGGVAIDTANGSAGTGSIGGIPVGTRRLPSNNIVDAEAIAVANGLNRFFLMDDFVLDAQDLSEGYKFVGDSPFIILTMVPSANVLNCNFETLTVSGESDGYNYYKECVLNNITTLSGFIFNCGLKGVVALSGDTTVMSCYSLAPGSNYPTIDINGANSLILRDWDGSVGITGATGGVHTLTVNAGRPVFNNTNTGGEFHIRGEPFDVVDNSGASCVVIVETDSHKITDLWDGTVGSGLTTEESAKLLSLPSKEEQAKATWDEIIQTQ